MLIILLIRCIHAYKNWSCITDNVATTKLLITAKKSHITIKFASLVGQNSVYRLGLLLLLLLIFLLLFARKQFLYAF